MNFLKYYKPDIIGHFFKKINNPGREYYNDNGNERVVLWCDRGGERSGGDNH